MNRFTARLVISLMLIISLQVSCVSLAAESACCEEKDKEIIQTEETELLKKRQSTDPSEPMDASAGLIGQVIRFETIDPEGNPVSSADLFKDNMITLVILWGEDCLNEMRAMADLHVLLQAKGCGVIGVEYENPTETAVDTSRQVPADNGIAFSNVIVPRDHPVFSRITSCPAAFFVDSEGRILASPITGAAVDVYEAEIDKLLAGEDARPTPDNGATANEAGEYRIIVHDQNGNPVKGAVIQICDESTCTLQKTDANGIAAVKAEKQTVYEVHVLKAPEGYRSTDTVFKTLDVWSDVTIILENEK